MSTPVTSDALEPLDFLAGLDPDERASLAAGLTTLALKRGEELVRQGEPADALYIVVSGRFSVTLAGRHDAISEIGPGQPVGEIAFLAGGTRTATVTALRDSLVLRLDRTEFDRLATDQPGIWRAISVTLARRLAEQTAARPAPPDPRPRTIAIIRAGGSPLPVAFLRGLARVFTARSRALFLAPDAVAGLLPGGTALESADATRALNALERCHDYVLFIADDEPTDWSEKAIRQADLVLAVALTGGDCAPNALEQLAARFVPREARRLVLVHPERGPARGTARWLSGRELALHHHVALKDDADIERLYRFVAGEAVGLVACGGAAFCAAHVGLFKALSEVGHSFDIMGGTSAGSAFTAAFALGVAPDDIDRAIHDIFVSNRAMRRYTWPRYSLLDHTHFDSQLKRHYGGYDIEDLWIPFFAVSTNLSTYALHRHRHGELWAAVRASGSIPVLLPPFYTSEGHMLVDGCLLDNVPIKVMHEIKSGPNVVVSFRVPDLERFEVDYGALPSRTDLMRLAVNPLRRHELPAAPGLATVLLRSLMANRQDFKRHLQPQDLLLVPPSPADMALLDWHRHTELMQATYRWTLDEMALIRAQGHPFLHATGGPGRSHPPVPDSGVGGMAALPGASEPLGAGADAGHAI